MSHLELARLVDLTEYSVEHGVEHLYFKQHTYIYLCIEVAETEPVISEIVKTCNIYNNVNFFLSIIKKTVWF